MFRDRVELTGALASMTTGGSFDRHPKPRCARLYAIAAPTMPLAQAPKTVAAAEWATAPRIGTEP